MMTEEARPEDAVVVTDESAVIVWDKAHHREHFIRGATFQGATRDIGFLVPSPSTPELKEANRGAFAILKKALEPKVEHRTKWEVETPLLILGLFFGRKISNTFDAAGSAMTDDDDAKSTGVEVLQTQTVAGYDATTLKADDANALNKWLNKNGYLVKADFKDWLQPYIEKGWVITAFKIRKADKNSKQFSSSLVRMSFYTDKPFFPYREPANQRAGIARKTPRSLRVFFISDDRVRGVLGDKVKRAWPGQTKWSDELSNHLDETERANLAKNLAMKPEQFPMGARMTSLEDSSSPRPGFDDVYFQKSEEQETITPPPIIIWQTREMLIPLDLIFGASLILFFIARARWKPKNQRTS